MEELIESAEKYYTSQISYHNFSHVEETLEAADELLTRCRDYGVEIDEEVVRTALVFHDAYYQKDADRFGYETKEDLSKEVARVELRKHGYDKDFISEVEGCIEATKHGSEPETNEQIAVRASDLRGLMGDYDEFRENSEALKEEHKQLYGSEPDYQQWFEGVLNTLNDYASQNLVLTPEHETEDGLSEFHAQLGKNIGQFIDDYVEEDMSINIAVSQS